MDVKSPAAFECAQAGCEACTEALLRRHEKLVHAVLRRQWRGEVAIADLLQEGRIGLWQAVLHFDPHRGYAFSTYAWYAIQNQMRRAVHRAQRQKERAAAWAQREHEGAGREPTNPVHVAEEGLWWEKVCASLGEMVAQLSEPHREVVVVYYGLDGGPPCTLAALGSRYGVTGEMVRVWRNEALLQLRMPLYSARLRELCGQDSRQAYARARRLNAAWLGRRRRRKQP
jgi:RNA polymerase nonessential primary-like sigma factor